MLLFAFFTKILLNITIQRHEQDSLEYLQKFATNVNSLCEVMEGKSVTQTFIFSDYVSGIYICRDENGELISNRVCMNFSDQAFFEELNCPIVMNDAELGSALITLIDRIRGKVGYRDYRLRFERKGDKVLVQFPDLDITTTTTISTTTTTVSGTTTTMTITPREYDEGFPLLYGGRNEPGPLPVPGDPNSNKVWKSYSRYHILSIGIHENSEQLHTLIKGRNPDIKIIGYVAAQEIAEHGPSRTPMDQLYDTVETNNWWEWDPYVNNLEDCEDKCRCSYSSTFECWDSSRGKCHAQNWPCTWNVDLTDNCPLGQDEWSNYRWNNGMPKFLSDTIFIKECGDDKFCWDGVFLDNFFYYHPAWYQGANKILQSFKEFSPEKIKIINGQMRLDGCYQEDTDCSGTCPYGELADYFLQEHFLGGHFKLAPDKWYGKWDGHMRIYVWWMKNSKYKGFVGSVSGDKWTNDDGYDKEHELHNYQRMRFGLTSTLMYDGYFAYRPHPLATLWYDEYSVDLDSGLTTQVTSEPNDFNEQDDARVGYLGFPIEDAHTSITNNNDEIITLKVAVSDPNFKLSGKIWQREFENGLVIVNPTGLWQTIYGLSNGKYRRISGIQDPSHNNGQIINEQVILQPEDGIILLKTNPLNP